MHAHIWTRVHMLCTASAKQQDTKASGTSAPSHECTAQSKDQQFLHCAGSGAAALSISGYTRRDDHLVCNAGWGI